MSLQPQFHFRPFPRLFVRGKDPPLRAQTPRILVNLLTKTTQSISKMANYLILVFVAVLAFLCSGTKHVKEVKEVTTLMKQHARVMSKEIEQRLQKGSKHSLAAHLSKRLLAENPSIEPTAEPTFVPTSTPSTSENVPTAQPAAQPTEDPDLSSTGFFYLTNSFNSDCSSPAVSVGLPVNTCLVGDSYSYKIRIVDGKPLLT